jgi:hypothetical protein
VGVRTQPFSHPHADVFFASANRVMMAAERRFARADQTLTRADDAFELGAAR